MSRRTEAEKVFWNRSAGPCGWYIWRKGGLKKRIDKLDLDSWLDRRSHKFSEKHYLLNIKKNSKFISSMGHSDELFQEAVG